MNELLSIKLRPKCLDEVIGQNHLIGENKILSNLIKNKKLFSMILYGNPGVGKTSIALAMAKELKMNYRVLNATFSTKKDFDIVFEEAKMYNGLILIIDEIHRLNKDKQDLLLPLLENGTITLIAMTTSNPYHSINPAIRSRCQLFKLNDLTNSDIVYALNRVVELQVLPNITIEKDTIKYIADLSGTDLRYAYNLLEISYYSTNDQNITLDVVKSINNKPNIIHDKNGDGYYDLLSAFQKSIRGSDVNASLYYLGRLILGDEIDSICRRLAVIVYEDIGLANPSMGPKVMAAISSAKMLGLPEARIPLAEIVIELALSPKSNSAELAIDNVIDTINKGNTGHIPPHLHNGNPDYKYPHNYPNSYVNQDYLPSNIKDKVFYKPKNNKNERLLQDIINNLNKIK